MYTIGYPLRTVRGHPRLFSGLAASAVAFFLTYLAPMDIRLATRLLIGWNVGALLYFVLSAMLMASGTAELMRLRAKASDEGRFLILVLTCLAAAASMGAIVAQLGSTEDMKGMERAFHVSLAALTIVTSWTFIHLTFALHYAHEYFDEQDMGVGVGGGRHEDIAGGLKFPGTDDPDYWDFMYFSFHHRRRLANRRRRDHRQGDAPRLAGAFDPGVLFQQRRARADD